MWKKLVFVFSVMLALSHGQEYDYLDTLGERISARVNAQVAPLNGLGQRINAEVQRSLRPMQKELDGLGNRISEQVYKGLEPVRAIELNLAIAHGVGGITIATHQPSGRQIIVKNSQQYICNGEIDTATGNCSDKLLPFSITASSPRSDWCYVSSFGLVNNQICLSTSGSTSISVINGEIHCNSYNSATMLISLDEYKKLCSGVRETTEIRYIPDLNDQRHVKIPNENQFVKCENRQTNLCVRHEQNTILNTYNSFGSNNIIIQTTN